MTLEEISNEFDVLLQPYMRQMPYGKVDPIAFDEYEKSVILTAAQEEVIKEIYSGTNSTNSFEKTEEVRRYLSNLVVSYEPQRNDTYNNRVSDKSSFYNIPEDVWFIVYESVDLKDDNLPCKENKQLTVYPVTHDEFHRIKNNPFRGSNKNRVLRLDLSDNIIELVSDYNIEKYKIRYLKRPYPIILTEGISINNKTSKQESDLSPALLRMILERAIRIAVQSKAMLAGNN